MNTAARMEHLGVKDKIQVSQETADLLIAAGKWYAVGDAIVLASFYCTAHLTSFCFSQPLAPSPRR
jgi:Adenylate and Guanylate cyclase catalytic domain